MADKPFRILLDLTDLHIESFNYVWISVSPRELKTIADLKKSLLKRINLGTKNIRLFVHVGVLLDEETITVLREDDTVKVQYEEQFHSCQNLSNNSLVENRSSRKRDFSEYNQEEACIDPQSHNTSNDAVCAIQSEISMESMKKSRKKHKKSHNTFHNEEFAIGTVENSASFLKKYQKKREKSCISTENCSKDLFEYENENEISFVSQQIHCNTKKSNKNDECKINKNEKEIAIASFEDTLMNDKTFNKTKGDSDPCKPLNSTECNRELKNNCPKKKRKRRKKSKKPELDSPAMFCVNNDTSVNNEFKSFSNETSGSVKRKHIVFTSCSPEPVKKSLEISLQFHNNDVQTAYTHKDVPTPILNNNTEHFPKISTPAQSDECMDPNWHVSLRQKENLDAASDEIESSKKLNSKNSKYKKVVNEQNAKENSCDLSHANVLPLNSRPEIGAHIFYKILELNENYCPEVSEYREGVVKSINPDNDEMEIELLKHEIKPGKIGKFENLKLGEVPLPEIKTKDIVSWSALIEPKITC